MNFDMVYECEKTMPLFCDDLSANVVSGLNRRLLRCDPSHPLYQQAHSGNVIVSREGDYVIYQQKGKFYFHRLQYDIETTIIKDMFTPRNCLVIPFMGGDSVQQFIEDKSVYTWRDFIESVTIRRDGQDIQLVKIPANMVRSLMSRSGNGSLRTYYYGDAIALAACPLLNKHIQKNVPGRIGSVFATAYGKDTYDVALSLHWRLVSEVVARPNSGICLKFVGQWNQEWAN